MIKSVQVIKREGKAALVEYIEGENQPQRVYIPAARIQPNGTVDTTELERGIPYGVPWSEYIHVQVSPERLERELQRVGIWTAADLMSNPNAAIGAIQAAIGLDLAALIRAAQEWATRERRT